MQTHRAVKAVYPTPARAGFSLCWWIRWWFKNNAISSFIRCTCPFYYQLDRQVGLNLIYVCLGESSYNARTRLSTLSGSTRCWFQCRNQDCQEDGCSGITLSFPENSEPNAWESCPETLRGDEVGNHKRKEEFKVTYQLPCSFHTWVVERLVQTNKILLIRTQISVLASPRAFPFGLFFGIKGCPKIELPWEERGRVA